MSGFGDGLVDADGSCPFGLPALISVGFKTLFNLLSPDELFMPPSSRHAPTKVSPMPSHSVDKQFAHLIKFPALQATCPSKRNTDKP